MAGNRMQRTRPAEAARAKRWRHQKRGEDGRHSDAGQLHTSAALYRCGRRSLS